MSYRVALTALVVFVCAPSVQAQTVVAPAARVLSNARLSVGSAVPVQALGDSSALDEDEDGDGPEEGKLDASTPEGQAQQQRLQQIQQLQFDRRPSTILKVWNEAQAEEAAAAAKAAEAENDAEQPAEDKPAKDQPAAAPAAEAKPAPSKPEEPKPAESKPADGKPAEGAKGAEDEAKKKGPSPEELAQAAKQFTEQLTRLQRDVTLGRWSDVKSLLASLPKFEAKAIYRQMLAALLAGPQGAQRPIDINALQQLAFGSTDPVALRQALAAAGQGPGAAMMEKNLFGVSDVVGLALASPTPLNQESFARLGTLSQQLVAGGHDVDALVAAFAAKPEGSDTPVLDRRQLAQLLMSAGEEVRAGEFLPTLDEARGAGDREALNLLARHYLALHAKNKKTPDLEQAWAALQEVLAAEKEEGREQKTQKEEALRRAVELAPRLREELGQRWLDESFSKRLDRGREILGTIGTHISHGLQTYPNDSKHRHKTLELQKTAVEALLRAAPETAQEWRETLNLLATNWLREAQVTYKMDDRNRLGPQWRRDRYGNFFYIEDEAGQNLYPQMNGMLAAISTGELLDVRPSDEWLALVDESLQARFAAVFSQLYLKGNEEEQAFPYIERLAQTDPEMGRELAHEFLRVWARNHDPNADRGSNTPYMYIWGYEQRAESIPLTRSKQERNLKELAEWTERLRALPIEDLDEKLIVQAFTASHSQAEVYRLETLEQVFGTIDVLAPKTLAGLIQDMRRNLATVWRTPAVQEKNKTKRKQKDIQAEVEHGYQVAEAVVARAREKHPDDWTLQLAEAAVRFDLNDYRQEISPNSEFSANRDAAMQLFAQAAEMYAAALPSIPEDQQSAEVYEMWYYASLGSVDLGRVTASKVPDLRQPASIRQAIESLPGDAAERHMAEFANHLFTRLSQSKAELKFRYLRTGFEIVGDHKLAREARKVLDYYDDLVAEIKLETEVDGSADVGHGKAFGVYVNLVHTKEIERESGGFGRYLQNQNASNYYSYNYGRPTEDYRDRFSEATHQALDEHFEIVSITFQDPNVTSKALPEYGWRVTPYAYLLLKARGPEVDKLPPLRLNLDFLDTSGYAIIPVESPALPVDAHSDTPPARPRSNVSIVQTLDERQAVDGKLVLEVKATAHGLVPELSELIELAPAGFDVIDTVDEGVSVAEFDKESDATTITSERVWLVSMQAKEAESKPQTFSFATSKLPDAKLTYQRYVDADLAAVEPTISLEQSYGRTSYAYLWILGSAVAALCIGGVAVRRLTANRQTQTKAPRFAMPEPVNAFTVLGLLRDIELNDGLGDDGRRDLVASIERIERHYFVESERDEPPLRSIAEQWLERTSRSRG
ncbi:MAG: hypothetical protein KF708_18560 [Pirellulales bacterium]|nr:hypothetical protein [Pirellulales bacterium]